MVWGQPEVDPGCLALAIEKELSNGNSELDCRTKILIRDSTKALEQHLGSERFGMWLERSQIGDIILQLQKEELGDVGFPSLRSRLMEKTDPEIVKTYLRELGSRISKSATLEIGGSIALILAGYLSRSTEDVDIIDEVPQTIREQIDLLSELESRYGLVLTHFQSHYLPSGWNERLHDLGSFGSISVRAVDVYDAFVGKLFSSRTKDLDDLRAISARIDKAILVDRFSTTAKTLRSDSHLQEAATKNWYILFGEELPS